jgi:hypothetical protein
MLQDFSKYTVVALQPNFYSEKVIDEFVDEANLIG